MKVLPGKGCNFRDIFTELDDAASCWEVTDRPGSEMAIVSKTTGQSYRLDVKIRERITPQIADDLFRRLREEPLLEHVVRIAYAPVISSRVAEIARRYDVSFMDYAGNCRIVDRTAGGTGGSQVTRTKVYSSQSNRTLPLRRLETSSTRTVLCSIIPLRAKVLSEFDKGAKTPELGALILFAQGERAILSL